MPARNRLAYGAALLLLLSGATEMAAQQAGRATGQAARDFDRRDGGRRPLGDALQYGNARGYVPGLERNAFGWLPAWSGGQPGMRLLCRPVPTAGGHAPGTFLAECTTAPLGYFGAATGAGGYGYSGYGGYGYGWAPPPIVLPPEERPHRFYSEFHPNAAGSGVPPLTCDPRAGAPCPPVQSAAVGVLPSPGPVPGRVAPGAAPGGDCAEVTARAVNGALYRGRASLAVLGVERPEDAALAIEAALARGTTVALTGEHGYPLYLPPVAFLESVESRACRR